eukprot:CAMPEP_0184025096 /NCGR_PEP_ID=MMETSP0954-20121128/12557_1 /TAXON_ID=627963 /ORGANISM="Aplanochytrium sp, Strain PBS07" /LENGTH=216 /DNA_ID=CAMNT_0026308715 /DNA_START=90 /DNA_END=740 /DNA_ORIENTATION=+
MGCFGSSLHSFDFQTAKNGSTVRHLTYKDREAAVKVFVRSFSGIGAPPEGFTEWLTSALKGDVAFGFPPRRSFFLFEAFATMMRLRTIPPWEKKKGEKWANVKIKMDISNKLMGSLKKKHNYDQGYYLANLAVDPRCQGQGVGKALLQTLRETANKRKVPCFLEAVGDRNIGVYEHFGYNVEEEIIIDVSNHPSVKSLTRRAAAMKYTPVDTALLE